FADRLSDREKFLITGDYYKDSEITYKRAIEAYSKLIALYPEDPIGNQCLGNIYVSLEEWDKAIERLKVAASNKTELYFTYSSLAFCYDAKGMYEKSEEILRYYLDNFSDNAGIHQALAASYIIQGEMDLAMAETEEAFILEPDNYMNFIRKGDIYLYQGDLVKAEEEFQKRLNTREPVGQGWGMWRLARLYQLQGRFEKAKELFQQAIEHSEKSGQKRWEAWNHWRTGEIDIAAGNPMEALKECEKALNIAKEREYLTTLRSSLHLRGLALLDIKSMDEARRVANELKRLIQEGIQKKVIRYYYHLMGMLELERENLSKAIDYFDKALSLEPSQHSLSEWPEYHALFIDALALAYYKAGDMGRAQEEYEKITNLTTGRLCFGHIYAKSFYMLGKIYEQQGDKAKAIEHYEKFLSLWKNADSGIPEVEDAKKRLGDGGMGRRGDNKK
ncbi:MAG: tetratricopeptide repeat protein, partial [Candidatus Aminicenantes bacterium]|nr:tetratricopeptide repeat protein [Candidatus Aminicenantes bacterium]